MQTIEEYLVKHIRICNHHGNLQILKPGEDPEAPHAILEFEDVFEQVVATRKQLAPLFEDYALQYFREGTAALRQERDDLKKRLQEYEKRAENGGLA